MAKKYTLALTATAIAMTTLAFPASAEPASTLSDDYVEGGTGTIQVDFQPISDEARVKVFDRVAEDITTTVTSRVTRTPDPITTQRTVTVNPENARSISDDAIILPPDWEGFVDNISTVTRSVGSNNAGSPSNSLSSSSALSRLSSIEAPRYDNATVQAIIDYAYSQLGVDYVWGGTTSGVGLDCSGLTQNAYRAAGISIPRVTYDQINSGPHIPISDVQPGDLVFWNNTGHVGLSIGNGQVIHAPQTGDVVKIDSITMMPIQAVVRPSR